MRIKIEGCNAKASKYLTLGQQYDVVEVISPDVVAVVDDEGGTIIIRKKDALGYGFLPHIVEWVTVE